MVLGLAWASGSGRGWVVAMAGLVLIPSAMASDVGFRASGRFGGPGAGPGRSAAIGLAVGAGWLVARPGQSAVAAGCVVGAEVALDGGPAGDSTARSGPGSGAGPGLALARRGAVAGATRFGRVSLYAADVLAIGWWAGPSLGPYAAARRVAFALLALGLVVPSAVAPADRPGLGFGRGRGSRSVIARTLEGLLAVALPATVGLMATADRWMPRLFGDDFRDGGPWLALIAARLPFVLVSNVQQAALIACRREGWAFRLIAGDGRAGVRLDPAAGDDRTGPGAWARASWWWRSSGRSAAGWRSGGWGWLPRGITRSARRPLGCVGVAGVCWVGRGWPLGGGRRRAGRMS